MRERRKAAALARHYRDEEGLLDRRDRPAARTAEATVKAYLYDPTGDKARAVKAARGSLPRLRGADRATERQGRRLRILQTLPSRRDRAGMDTGTGPRSNPHMASALRGCAVLLRLVAHPRTRRGGEALKRLQAGEWPAPSTVIDLYGSWAGASPTPSAAPERIGIHRRL